MPDNFDNFNRQNKQPQNDPIVAMLKKATNLIEEAIKNCLKELGNREPFLPSWMIEDFKQTKEYFVEFVSAYRTPKELVPFIIARYIVTGTDVFRIEEDNGAFLLRLHRSIPGEWNTGVALLGLPQTISLQAEIDDFCEVWFPQEEQKVDIAALNCTEATTDDLAECFTALYIPYYLDLYLWQISQVPGFKQALWYAAEQYTGYSWEQISDMEKRWKEIQRFS